MDVSIFALFFMFLSLLECGEARYYYGYSGSFTIYSQWWFWLIFVVIILMKLCCLGCYVKHKRNRRAQNLYAQTIANGGTIQQQANFPDQPGFAYGVNTHVGYSQQPGVVALPPGPPPYPTGPQAGFTGQPGFANGVNTHVGYSQQPGVVALPSGPPPYPTGPQSQWNSKSNLQLPVSINNQPKQ